MTEFAAKAALRHMDVPFDPQHFSIRVYGDPVPEPKKVGCMRGNRLVTLKRDWKVRKVNGERRVVDRGAAEAWRRQVQVDVGSFLSSQGKQPFPMNHPIAIGMLFYLANAKNSRLSVPVKSPDLSNLWYLVENALKRTPARNGISGPFPEGILYYDDDQIVDICEPTGKRWADAAHPAGVLITVCDRKTEFVKRAC